MFKGNPHDCTKYNKGGQQKFYQELVNEIGKEMCGASKDEIPIPCDDGNHTKEYVTKLCGNLKNGKKFVFDECNDK